MAKFLKFYFEYESMLGESHRVEIWEEGTTTTTIELQAGADPFTAENNNDVAEKYLGGIVPTVATIMASATDVFNSSYFSKQKFGDYVIKFLVDSTVKSNAIITPFEANDIDKTGGYPITLSAECGLRNLKNKKFTPTNTRVKLISVLKSCLAQIGFIDTFPIKVIDNTKCYDGTILDASPVKYWEAYCDDIDFDGLDCYAVIDRIRKPYNQVFFDHVNGSWFVRNVDEISSQDSNIRTYNWSDLTYTDASYNRPTKAFTDRQNGNFGRMFSHQSVIVKKDKSNMPIRNSWGKMDNLTDWTFAGTSALYWVINDGRLYNSKTTFSTPEATGVDGSYIQSPQFLYTPYQTFSENEKIYIEADVTMGSILSNLRMQIITGFNGPGGIPNFLGTDGNWYSVENDQSPSYAEGKFFGTPIYEAKPSGDKLKIEIPRPPYHANNAFMGDLNKIGTFGYWNSPFLPPFFPENAEYYLIIRLFYPERGELSEAAGIDATDELYGLFIDNLHIKVGDVDVNISEGFERKFTLNDTQDRETDLTVNIGIGYPSFPTGTDSLFKSTDDSSLVNFYSKDNVIAGEAIDLFVSNSYLKVLGKRLKTYQGTIREALGFGDLISIMGVKYRLHNAKYNARRHFTDIKAVELATNSTSTIQDAIILPDDTKKNIQEQVEKAVKAVEVPEFSSVNFEKKVLPSGKTVILLNDAMKLKSAFADVFYSKAESGGVITTQAEDTENDYTQIKPAASGTYALEEWVEDNAWMLGGNTLTAAKSIGSINNYDVSVIRNSVTKATFGATVTDFDATTYNFKNGGTTYATLNSTGLGIGTTSPSAKLEVQKVTTGNTSEYLQKWTFDKGYWWFGLEQKHVSGSHLQWNFRQQNVGNNDLLMSFKLGKVGFGTESPTFQNHIYGTGQATNSGFATNGNSGAALYIQDSGNSAYNGGTILFGAYQGSFAAIKSMIRDGGDNTKGDLDFQTRNSTSDNNLTSRLFIQYDGKIGVNTLAPTDLFHVNGTTRTTNLKITNGATVGYVWQCNNADGSGVWTSPLASERYIGEWAANSGSAPSGSPTTGDYWVVNAAGTYSGATYAAGDEIYWNGSTWLKRSNYLTLPIASASVLGGIKIGSGLSIDGSGILSRNALVAADIPSLDWSKISTGKPTTVAGYGITDVWTKIEADGRYVDLSSVQSSIGGAKTFTAGLTAQSFTSTSSLITAGVFSTYGITYNTLGGTMIQSGSQLYFAYKPLVQRASHFVFDRGFVKIGGNTSGLPADIDFATERLEVVGNIRYSGTLKPNNVQGTAGMWLKNNGTGNPDTWSAITHGDITNLGDYTGFDARYYTKTLSDARYVDFDTPQDINAVKSFLAGLNFGYDGSLKPQNISFTGGAGSIFGANVLETGSDLFIKNTKTLFYTGTAGYALMASNGLLLGSGLNELSTPTERLHLNGNFRYSGTLKPANQTPTAGMWLKAPTTSTNAWDFITSADITDVNAANKLLKINSSGLIDSQFLPAYVDDVLEFANVAAFPGTGETGKIYVAIDANRQYRWSGSSYVQIVDGKATWGGIDGTLSAQTDLQTALNARQPLASNLTAIAALTTNGILKRISGTWQMASQIAMSEVNGLTEILPLKQDQLLGNGVIIGSGGSISYVTGTEGQVLTKDASGAYNFMNLEINPPFLTHKRLAVGSEFDNLSETNNLTFEAGRMLRVANIANQVNSVNLGVTANDIDGILEYMGLGDFWLKSQRDIYIDNFKGGGDRFLKVTNEGKVYTTASGGGSSSQDLDSVLSYGNTANNKTMVFKNDSTNIFTVRTAADVLKSTFGTGAEHVTWATSGNVDIELNSSRDLRMFVASGRTIMLGESAPNKPINLYGENYLFHKDNLFQGANKWGAGDNQSTPQNGDIISYVFFSGSWRPIKTKTVTTTVGGVTGDFMYITN